jgi:hypothetical protein
MLHVQEVLLSCNPHHFIFTTFGKCRNFLNILHHTLIRDNCDLKMWKGNKFERTYQGQIISNIENSI